ncbi:MAG: DUF1549 domain-containing protein [Planctomycetota bacterium]|nr:MAG: DUF1549 domain-containing protein [Planctomycetota bacterium]
MSDRSPTCLVPAGRLRRSHDTPALVCPRPDCTRRGPYARAVSALAVLVGFACMARATDGAEPQARKPAAVVRSEQGLRYYREKVLPLLKKHCWECHSATSKPLRGNLRLDTPAGWLRGGDSGPAVVPHDRNSLLLSAVRYEDYEMPPRGKLSPQEIATLERWVEMGAPAPADEASAPREEDGDIDWDSARRFWAFQPPRKHPLPDIPRTLFGGGPGGPPTWIDRFVGARLHQAGLRPAPPADRATLLRRVFIDLTGLPPTPEQVRAFLRDERPDAYERVVDRLLASPRFGETWGRHWLDLARYADSNGGDINLTYYNAWRYRDYVIASFNQDKPYDVFVREQIAGDLMPAASEEQAAERLIATGFLMVGPKMLSERDKTKLRLDVVDEQLQTIGTAFLGLTVGCARCHDHKFDPIPSRDYYALAGFLYSTHTIEGIRLNNVNVSGWLERPLPISREREAYFRRIQQELEEVRSRIKTLKARIRKTPSLAGVDPKRLDGIVIDDTQAEKVGTWKRSTYSPRYVGEGYIHDNREQPGHKRVVYSAEIPAAGKYEIRISYPYAKGRATKVRVIIDAADGRHTVTVDQSQPPDVVGLFKKLGRFHLEAGRRAVVTITNTGTDGYVIADAVQILPAELADQLADLPARTWKQPAGSDETTRLRRQLASLEERSKQLSAELARRPMAMAVRDAPDAGDLALRIRGEPHRTGPTVPRGFLTVTRHLFADSAELLAQHAPGDETAAEFIGTPEGFALPPQGSGREALAAWITDPRNPLTARVIANRVWHHLFGQGIVPTVDNFGNLGERPSHPQLLDMLAVRFVEHGWSIKWLVREIVLSATYRQSSAAPRQTYERAQRIDPRNRLLWRHRLRRLTAESLRDTVLFVSGQLDETMGGSTVADLPEQAVANSSKQEGGVDIGKFTRRTVYLPVVRNALPTLLTAFDFANPEMCTGRRSVTGVPTQALVLLNSPLLRNAAQRIADAMLAALSDDGRSDHPTAHDRRRLRWLAMRIWQRPPDEIEARRLLQAVAEARARLGDAPDDFPDEHARRRERRIWTDVAHAMLASVEFWFYR